MLIRNRHFENYNKAHNIDVIPEVCPANMRKSRSFED